MNADNIKVEIKPIVFFMTILTPLCSNQSIIFFYEEFDQFMLSHCGNRLIFCKSILGLVII
ncbi:TPA: hypothetical protein JIZ13_06775 [Acinetobacter nosocomialis]|uniref:Uncharacterized protein n=1 Tax=Acinetobacter nosocomialis TaxID=106654 RepID=A0A1V0YWC5_ACINO|nr:hypothetical protein B7L44_19215 [Acinetobacter nosocomialis]MPS62620.1 hypothetical protein [Acinetobacter sp.]PNN09186.1 hypothetical protein AL489_003890 [Acinetobacter sp. FDAARGOS_131]QCP63846.1 hypothetical protein FDQ49_08090 [Acinetobacter nosocomialis M2]RSB94784.1 hypothetical protein EGS33_11820 [Acinetobacter sp. FDAARGOS_541]